MLLIVKIESFETSTLKNFIRRKLDRIFFISTIYTVSVVDPLMLFHHYVLKPYGPYPTIM
jgi:hypothetical protein